MADINRERAKGVREGWKNERALIMDGKGTRQWSQREQIGIIRKNQARGYDGHHMKSVKTYPEHAANPNNIQFLNKKEHIQGAHKGNTKNSTNGYYNTETKTMHNFGNRNPQAPQVKQNAPLSRNQISSAIKREQYYQSRVNRDRAYANQWRQSNGYSPMFPQKGTEQTQSKYSNKGIENMSNKLEKIPQNSSQTSQNKGITSARQKANPSPSSNTTKSTNQGIKSYQSKTSEQNLSASKTASSSATKGSSNSSGGKSVGSSQSK